MDTWILTPQALQEPWRFWTCHLAHHGWQHAADNSLALAIPLVLAQKRDRIRVFLWLLLLAPVLSLALMPFLQGGSYQGLSGLACAAWALVGLQLAVKDDTCLLGISMLGLLALKFAVESMTGSGILFHEGRWQELSESHLFGTLLGLSAGMADRAFRRQERRFLTCTTALFRKAVTIPR